MSDRMLSCQVIFDKDYKDEDAKVIMDAISMIKGVAKVVPRVAITEDYIAYTRARQDLRLKLFEALKDE